MMSIPAATSRPTPSLIPEYFGKPLYDIPSGRFDPVGLRYALLRREMNPEQLAVEAVIGRSTVYKALKGEGVGHDKAMAILGALGRHPPSLPSID